MPELLRRTARESWEDSVFGQGGRMAFYQFLAVFPCLLVFIAVGSHIPRSGGQMRVALIELSRQILPDAVSAIFQRVTADAPEKLPVGLGLLVICAGAMWSAFNTTWAMIYGLNRAYEVRERRSWRMLSLTIGVLTFALALIGCCALLLLFGTSSSPDVALDWFVLCAALAGCFALLYRFAPDVPGERTRHTMPGTIFAVILWVGTTLAARVYFNRIDDYTHSYGQLNGVAILLLWLYFSNGAILIGGEMNSEIEKAVQSS